MNNLAYPWAEYLRLQNELNNTSKVSNRTWGLEEGLNSILVSQQMGNKLTEDEIDRAISNQERCERNRANLRIKHFLSDEEDATNDPRITVEVQQELNLLKIRVTDQDWDLLNLVAMGCEYIEIAAYYKVLPGKLRTNVVRLRKKLVKLAA